VRVNKIHIVLLLAVMMLTGCGVKKRIHPSCGPTQPESPTWHTCLIQGAKATVNVNGDKLSASVTMQTVRDSMLVISVIPMLGMEMVRFEATPFELIGINKLDGTYATTTYTEVNRKLVPTINWDVLQQLCSAELPTGSEQARLLYTLDDMTIEMTLVYPERKLDVPVRVTHQNVSRYKKVEIQQYFGR